MATTAVKVADHMAVVYQGLTAVQPGSYALTSPGTSELNSTQHVSTVGANTVALSVNLHAVVFGTLQLRSSRLRGARAA